MNIEVKTPNYASRINQEKRESVKVFFAERCEKHEEILESISKRLNKDENISVENLRRMDNKLKDYLCSAQKKFPSSGRNFNVLVVALELMEDLDEWYLYLFGQQGAFTEHSFIEEKYDNVDAVLLCNSVTGLHNWEKYSEQDIDVWDLENNLCFLLLDPRKEKTDKGKYYFEKGMFLFGELTSSFLMYLDNEMDKDMSKKNISSELFYIEFMISESTLISDFYAKIMDSKSDVDKTS